MQCNHTEKTGQLYWLRLLTWGQELRSNTSIMKSKSHSRVLFLRAYMKNVSRLWWRRDEFDPLCHLCSSVWSGENMQQHYGISSWQSRDLSFPTCLLTGGVNSGPVGFHSYLPGLRSRNPPPAIGALHNMLSCHSISSPFPCLGALQVGIWL